MASSVPSEPFTLFLSGDVMTGRGVDQVLPTPSHPRLYEPYVQNAAQYVDLAEAANGPVPEPVEFGYVWGDALEALDKQDPDFRIINLETAVTTSNDFWPDKGIHYRMHPANIPVITVAGIDCCVIANNHTLDWGRAGLKETIATLKDAGLNPAGCGRNLAAARTPSILEAGAKGRVLVFACALPSSGVPLEWAATKNRAGVNFLPNLSEAAVRRIAADVQRVKRERDVVVLSIHWGGNWGYAIPDEQRAFAHRLVDDAGVDVVHGHSSHHPKAIEIYRDRPIMYGCGDFLNDYEGIGGRESYRSDLVLMYLVTMLPESGKLSELLMVPFEIRQLQLSRVSRQDAEWLQEMMDRECGRFGGSVELTDAGRLRLIVPG